MKHFIKITFGLGVLFFFSACVKDKPESHHQTPPQTNKRKVWIANEGSLGSGNASLSLLYPEQDSVYNNVFKQINGSSLGDVLQSMTLVNGRLFLAINNSDKIKVINDSTFNLIGVIPVLKPRYMLPVSETKMYVTSLYHPDIYILNPKTLQVTGQISVDFPNTEGLTKFKGKVYVCNWDTACDYIYEINPTNDQITHRIPIAGYAPQQVMIDKNNHLWVFAGNIEKGKSSTLTCINPKNGTIIKSFQFSQDVDILKPVWNKNRDTLYFLGVDYNGQNTYNGVFRMSINARRLPTTTFIKAQSLQYFWGLGIDTVTHHIFVGDPKGFLQRGEVLIYNKKGDLLKSYQVGVGPGAFLFQR